MDFPNKNKFLLPMLSFTGILLLGRFYHTRSLVFIFIPWNLFLALVPLYISHRLSVVHNRRVGFGLLTAWLLFFPNTMYIITDLFHLHEREGMPQWYDLLILCSAAFSGVVMGFLSLRNVERYLLRTINPKQVPWVILSCFFLCGYGIYLGRYLRWNSWSIITRPVSLLLDVKQDIFHPIRNDQCWMLSILFGIWLYILYKYFKKISIAPGEEPPHPLS